MRAHRNLSIACSVVLAAALLGACKRDVPDPQPAQQSPPALSATAMAANDHHVSPPWFGGTSEQAFARAKADGSLVFLYWGAAWCPPCNELKAQVFNKPNFAELVRGFVPVYLDGDTPDAQRLAESFSVAAYPTIVILGPEKNELLRLGGSLDSDEVERALAAVRTAGQSFSAALNRLSSENPSANDCSMLAHTAWELLPEEQWPRSKVLVTLRSAVDVCPVKLSRERAIFASTLIGMASMARNDSMTSATILELEPKLQSYFDIIFASADTAWAARAFVNNRASDVAQWFSGKNASLVKPNWKSRWLDAADLIRARNEVSVDVRLSTYLPMLEFDRHEHPDKPVQTDVRNSIVQAVEQADQDAKSPAERHAVISTAAYLLRQVGLPDKAKTMLLTEAEKTDTPFYYYSTLSAQEQALGHADEAKKWSRKARESAAGRATRLQWITHDVLLNGKPNGSEERRYLLALADEFYSLAVSLDDGFVGRNRLRAKQVKGVLAALQGEDVDKLFARHKATCASLAPAPQSACHAHFE